MQDEERTLLRLSRVVRPFYSLLQIADPSK